MRYFKTLYLLDNYVIRTKTIIIIKAIQRKEPKIFYVTNGIVKKYFVFLQQDNLFPNKVGGGSTFSGYFVLRYNHHLL